MKYIRIFLLLTLCIFLIPATAAAQLTSSDFTDIQGHWAESEISKTVNLGLMSGLTTGQGIRIFAPENNVSRAQLASVLNRTFQLDYGEVRFIKAPTASDYYNDVEDKAWYADSAVMCAINNIFNDGIEFKPEEYVSRVELARCIQRCFNAKNISVPMIMVMPDYSDIDSLADEDRNAVIFVSNTGTMKGDQRSFRPDDPVKRCELARVLNQCPELMSLNEGFNGPDITPPKDNSTLQLSIKPVKSQNELIDVELNIPQISGIENEQVQSAINQQFIEDANTFRNNIEPEARDFKNNCEKSGYPFRPYAVCTGCERYYENGKILSLYVDYYQYTGGAHGSTERRAYNYDLETGEKLELKDLFQAGYDYKTILNQQIKEKIDAQPEYYFEGDLGFKTINEKNFYIENDCLVLYFDQYEIAPYAAGFPQFKLQLHLFPDNLKTELLM